MNSDVPEWLQGVATRTRSLVAELTDLDYRFREIDAVLPGPRPDVEAQLSELQRLIGPVPLVLAAFYRAIGSIDLRGSHPQWTGCTCPDPLVIEPIEAVVAEAREYTELADPSTEYWASESDVFRAPLSPDAYHKAGQSGGMWYGVEIPAASPDPVVLEEPHRLPFSQYLEFALSWGGFPGLERCPDHAWPLPRLRAAARAG